MVRATGVEGVVLVVIGAVVVARPGARGPVALETVGDVLAVVIGPAGAANPPGEETRARAIVHGPTRVLDEQFRVRRAVGDLGDPRDLVDLHDSGVIAG